ncbi:MAG: hypothetical protein M3P26_05370 [Gemmatimonadota bacterium]|nr:hypothetical protein [Gemmatimonadota bacterium]
MELNHKYRNPRLAALAAVAISLGAVMTIITQTPATVAQSNKIWRKVQGDIGDGIQFECEEDELISSIKDASYDWSLREVTAPVDLNEDGGVSSIDEGAYESVASSPNAEEISVAPIFLNKRFECSRFQMYIDEHGGDTQIRKVLKHNSLHAVRAISRQKSDYFWGSSTAILALTDTDITTATSQTITLKNGYGRSDITNAAFIADKFRVNERVAVLNAGVLVLGAVGKITAISTTTPSLTITFDVAPTADATNNLQVVKANTLDNAKSDYNRGLVGMVDGMFTASVHGLSHANWVVAKADTTGGRFSGVRLHGAADEVNNQGGGKINKIFMAQGVYRDQLSLYQAAVRYDDPFAMEMDGDVKSKGRKFFKSRRVPNGYTIVGDMSGLTRWQLLPNKDGSMRWGDGKEREDRSAIVFRIDVPLQLIWKNRKKFGYFTGLTEQ